MTAVTICSDFGAQGNKICHPFPLFPHLFGMKWWDWMPWSLFSECWVLRQLFHSLVSLSSRGSSVPFTFCHKGGVICISEVIDISPGNLNSSIQDKIRGLKCYCLCYECSEVKISAITFKPLVLHFKIWLNTIILCKICDFSVSIFMLFS